MPAGDEKESQHKNQQKANAVAFKTMMFFIIIPEQT